MRSAMQPLLGSSVFSFLFLIVGVLSRYYEDVEAAEDQAVYYSYMRDISVMIFFGFGYLMTFLRRAGYRIVIS